MPASHAPARPLGGATMVGTAKERLELLMASAAIVVTLLLTANSSMPWESDQAPKAAQILDVANRHDFLLSNDLRDDYRLRLFPVYYALSGLAYSITGGDVFGFMNLSSVAGGVITALGLMIALRRALNIRPVWTAVVLLAMPLFVITYTYGNETAWAMAFFVISLALLASAAAWQHVAAGVAVAAALSCRSDIILLAPFWLAWAALFARGESDEHWLRRLLRPSLAFIVAEAVLFALLVRRIPQTPLGFEFGFNPMLVLAYLTFPFSPSVVLIGCAGWLVLFRRRRGYALAHLLLLAPIAFYFGNLASPKYVISLLIFYGLPAAYVLTEVRRGLQALLVACMGIWFIVGVSNYGVFGPVRASRWYVPTADGPCPIGGYVEFYRQAHNGVYQLKQQALIDQLRALVPFARTLDGPHRIAGEWHFNAASYLRARGELGGPDDKTRLESIFKNSLDPDAQSSPDLRLLMGLSGYSNLAHTSPEFTEKVRKWLEQGQVRRLDDAADPLPRWIELGDHIPVGNNSVLGKRLLFVNEYFQGQMIFKKPIFIPEYRATSWLPREKAAGRSDLPAAIYEDQQFLVFDHPVEGADVYSYIWPARYYRMKSPKPIRETATENK